MAPHLDKKDTRAVNEGYWHWLLAIGASLLVLAAHPLGALVSTPYWLDEAWVALSTRVSVAEAFRLTASTPFGFTLLLRLVPDTDALRFLPLLFAGLVPAVGYFFGKRLSGPGSRAAYGSGLLMAAALLLAPFLLGQNELKQYTADAFMAVLILLLTARLDRRLTLKRMIALGAALPLGMLISHTAAIVGAASLGAAVGVILFKERTRLRAILAVAAAALILAAVYYYIADRRGDTASLAQYWQAYYPHLWNAPWFIYERLQAEMPLHNGFAVLGFLGLAASGVVALWHKGLRITSMLFPFVAAAAILLGVLRIYPLLDARTSTYLFTLGTVAAVCGVIDLCRRMSRHAPKLTPLPALAAVGCLLVLAAPLMRRPAIPLEDVRSAAQFVQSHKQRQDSVVVSAGAAYGFAYYWPAAPTFVPAPSRAVGFTPMYPGQHITVLTESAGAQLSRHAAQEAAGGRTVWIVVAHPSAAERRIVAQWTAAGKLVQLKGNAAVLKLN